MHAIIVGRGIPSSQNPLLGVFEFDQAKALAQAGIKVSYFSLDLRSIREKDRLASVGFEKDGISVFEASVPVGNVPPAWMQAIGSRVIKKLYRYAMKYTSVPDIIHSHFPEISGMAAALSKSTQIPLVVTEHSSQIMNRGGVAPGLFPIAQFAYQTASAVIAVSPALCDIIKQRFGIRPVYIPNIVDLALFQGRKKQKDVSEPFGFVSVGNMIPLKRHDLTIRAFYQAFFKRREGKQEPPRLTLIGGGPEEEKCRKLAEQFKIGDYVTITGRQTREEIAEHLAQADCFVLPSSSETFGVVYVEAMAAGLPVIATRCGGPAAFVNESNGVMIPVDDEEALVQAMIFMKENIARFDGRKISEKTEEMYSPKSIGNLLTAQYRQILDGGRG